MFGVSNLGECDSAPMPSPEEFWGECGIAKQIWIREQEQMYAAAAAAWDEDEERRSSQKRRKCEAIISLTQPYYPMGGPSPVPSSMARAS